MQSLGFVHYWWYEDYQTAAYWFEQASKRPGAPIWMAPLAAVTLAQGGNRHASRQLWQHIAQTESDEWFRNEAVRRLRQLDALDQIDALQSPARGVRDRARGGGGRLGGRLVRAGLLRGVPLDPTGLPYRIVNGRGRRSDPSSRLLPLPNPARLR